MSVAKVPTRTSISSAAPWLGRSRSRTAWTSGMPIQTIAEQGDAHRDRDPVAVAAVGADEGEEHREGGGEDQQDVEGGAEVGGGDQRRHGEVGGALDRAHRRRHREELAQAEDADADHRERRRPGPPATMIAIAKAIQGIATRIALGRLAACALRCSALARRVAARGLGARLLDEADRRRRRGPASGPRPEAPLRASNSRRHSSSASRPKSGQSSSRKTSSE